MEGRGTHLSVENFILGLQLVDELGRLTYATSYRKVHQHLEQIAGSSYSGHSYYLLVAIARVRPIA